MVQYSLDIFKDKQELVADMKICQAYIERLCDLRSSSASTAEIRRQQESLQENAYKIFVKWKEEWRFVLSFVPQFMTVALGALEGTPEELEKDDVLFTMVLDFLRNLTVCISPKRMVRYWPTQVNWLLKIVGWLELSLEADGDDTQLTPNWTTLYVLLLWLSSAIRTPFDLSRFDGQITDETETLEHRIDDIIKCTVDNYALLPVVHLLAGAFYSRPDIVRTSSRLERFICLLLLQLKSETSSINSKVSCLRSLASLLKKVDRTTLQQHVDQIVDTVLPMVDGPHELLTKLSVKILGRSALTRIRPRLVKWRYSCGKRIIEPQQEANAEPTLKVLNSTDEDLQLHDLDADEDEDDFDFDELPPYFESLVHTLLSNLNHTSSVVRFSVAKYLAAICSRLPQQFSGDILQHIVVNLCSETQDDLAWHGACLALAEFVRRGYVRIDFMSRIIEVVEKALFYEHIKGSFSLGTHVRDSAAYICWAMARAYDARFIGQFVARLAPLLLCAASFDRQLNVRRAASAVIQELSGRTQRFPHWIDVIGRTEFHELSLIEHTYLQLGVHFATSYPVFQDAIIEHLSVEKSTHWDPAIRRLSATALGLISAKVPFATLPQLPILQERTLEADLNARHGSILALAHIIANDTSLHVANVELAPFWRSIDSLVGDLAIRNLFAGIGGDYMRESCLCLIDQYCKRFRTNQWADQRQLGSEILASWSTLLLGTLQSNENDVVQCQVVSALVSYLRILSNDERQTFVGALLSILARHEHYYAISSISKAVLLMDGADLQDVAPQFTLALAAFIEAVAENPLRRSETVADAIKALLWIVDQSGSSLIGEETFEQVYRLTVKCLDDHMITNKGNVGLFVRTATIEALAVPKEGEVTPSGFLRSLSTEQLRRIVQLVAAEGTFRRNASFKGSLEKLARLATFCLKAKEPVLPSLYLEQLAKLNGDSQAEEGEEYRRLVETLSCTDLAAHLWSGLVCVLSDTLLVSCTKQVIAYLRNLKGDAREEVMDSFRRFFAQHAKDLRLSIPCLVAVKVLLLQVPTCWSFQKSIAEITWSACQGSCNPKKYLLACDVFCTLVPLEGDATCYSASLQNVFRFLYVLLGHKLPRVRVYTATELFTVMMAIDEEGSLMEAVQLLQQTDWLQLEEAKMARDQVRTIVKSIV